MDIRISRSLSDELCVYCGAKAETWDHVIPLSKGGRDNEANKAPACYVCNSLKGNMEPHDFISIMDSEQWLAVGLLEVVARKHAIWKARNKMFPSRRHHSRKVKKLERARRKAIIRAYKEGRLDDENL